MARALALPQYAGRELEEQWAPCGGRSLLRTEAEVSYLRRVAYGILPQAFGGLDAKT